MGTLEILVSFSSKRKNRKVVFRECFICLDWYAEESMVIQITSF
jgi:hypothetical protein